MGMSVTSRVSSRDGFRSFGNETPKLMKMAFSDVEEFRAAFFVVFWGLLGFLETIFRNFWIRIPKLWDFSEVVRLP